MRDAQMVEGLLVLPSACELPNSELLGQGSRHAYRLTIRADFATARRGFCTPFAEKRARGNIGAARTLTSRKAHLPDQVAHRREDDRERRQLLPGHDVPHPRMEPI